MINTDICNNYENVLNYENMFYILAQQYVIFMFFKLTWFVAINKNASYFKILIYQKKIKKKMVVTEIGERKKEWKRYTYRLQNPIQEEQMSVYILLQ